MTQISLDYTQLNNALKNAGDIKPSILAKRAATIMLTQTQHRFNQGIDPQGVKWQPSKRVQEAQGFAQTLIDNADLYKSITTSYDKLRARVGTNIIYAAIHQFGGKITIPAHKRTRAFGRNTKEYTFPATTKTMPIRAFLGFNQSNLDEISKILTDYIQEKIGAPT